MLHQPSALITKAYLAVVVGLVLVCTVVSSGKICHQVMVPVDVVVVILIASLKIQSLIHGDFTTENASVMSPGLFRIVIASTSVTLVVMVMRISGYGAHLSLVALTVSTVLSQVMPWSCQPVATFLQSDTLWSLTRWATAGSMLVSLTSTVPVSIVLWISRQRVLLS